MTAREGRGPLAEPAVGGAAGAVSGQVDAALVARIVRDGRRERGWSQEQLAELAGVSVRALRDLERGCVARPRPATTRRLADALDLPDDDRARLVDVSAPRPRPDSLRCLPPDLVALAGRDAELEAVLAGGAGRGRPPVLVHGPVGAGTTALLVRAAHLLADVARGPIVYVDLADLADLADCAGSVDCAGSAGPDAGSASAAVARHLLAALDEPVPTPGGIAATPDRATAHDRAAAGDGWAALGRAMSGGVLVLDGVRADDDIAAVLDLPCRVLVGSHGPLPGLDGVRRVPLTPLGDAAARDLLAGVLGADRLAAEADALEAFVALCDGWPLALSLVAARVAARPGWPLAETVQRLTGSAAVERIRSGDVSVCGVLDAAAAGLPPAALAALCDDAVAGSPWAQELPARGLVWPPHGGAPPRVGALVRAWAATR